MILLVSLPTVPSTGLLDSRVPGWAQEEGVRRFKGKSCKEGGKAGKHPPGQGAKWGLVL